MVVKLNEEKTLNNPIMNLLFEFLCMCVLVSATHAALYLFIDIYRSFIACRSLCICLVNISKTPVGPILSQLQLP